MTSAPLTYRLNSVEYVAATVTVTTPDIVLDEQPVTISIDAGATWLPAQWEGDAGAERVARTTNPVTFSTTTGEKRVLVKITATPEVPIVFAGTYKVVSS